jgi:hypothetical protein
VASGAPSDGPPPLGELSLLQATKRAIAKPANKSQNRYSEIRNAMGSSSARSIRIGDSGVNHGDVPAGRLARSFAELAGQTTRHRANIAATRAIAGGAIEKVWRLARAVA